MPVGHQAAVELLPTTWLLKNDVGQWLIWPKLSRLSSKVSVSTEKVTIIDLLRRLDVGVLYHEQYTKTGCFGEMGEWNGRVRKRRWRSWQRMVGMEKEEE